MYMYFTHLSFWLKEVKLKVYCCMFSLSTIHCYVFLDWVKVNCPNFIIALHWMQGGVVMIKLSIRPSIRLSVCPSVKRMICDKTKEICAHILIPHERSFILLLWKKNGWWMVTPTPWNFGWNWPRWSEIADFRSIFARSASAVTLSEKSSINTNRKSTTRFPMSP